MILSSRTAFASMALVLVGMSSCSKPSLDELTVWKETVPSPDRAVTAIAYTIQNGGFGSAHVDTIVDLKQRGSGPSITVLALDCNGPMPKPYTLDNIANRGGSVDLGIHWVDASHLKLSYRKHPRVEAVGHNAYGVSITIEEQQ